MAIREQYMIDITSVICTGMAPDVPRLLFIAKVAWPICEVVDQQ